MTDVEDRAAILTDDERHQLRTAIVAKMTAGSGGTRELGRISDWTDERLLASAANFGIGRERAVGPRGARRQVGAGLEDIEDAGERLAALRAGRPTQQARALEIIVGARKPRVHPRLPQM